MDSLPSTLPLPSESRTPARRIAVASGKGGVGKTWLAITLAHALAQMGARVLLFDGDLGLANIDIQLGLTPERDLASVIAGRSSLAQATTHFATGGFDILPGRSGSGALSNLAPPLLASLMAELGRQNQDIVLLDLGAGLDSATRQMSSWADTLLVVATDEPTSLTDAYAVLKLHAADRAACNLAPGARLVINQAASTAAGQRIYATLARACQQFLGHAPPLAGIIRRDERVRDAIRRQTPLLTRHPTSVAAEDASRLAKMLLQDRPVMAKARATSDQMGSPVG